MSGFNKQQLECKHVETKKAKVGNWVGLLCKSCKALLNPDKSLKTIKVTGYS